MRVLILGAGGMLGRKLAQRLASSGTLGRHSVSDIDLIDVVEPAPPPVAGITISTQAADLSDPAVAVKLAETEPDVIFHLAAVVSGEAEADFDKGYRVNLDATRTLLDALRAVRSPGFHPRVVFASSLAVFGSPLPDTIPDDYCLTPLTSYGTQKAIAELLLADYSRRGFIDGVAVRLPTICVRPGAPNRAASGFFSGIIREPLNGQQAVLPVPSDVRHWFASPRAAVSNLLHAATLDSAALAERRFLTLPGVSATVGDQIEALRRVGGDAAVKLIQHRSDPDITRIIAGWPERFDTARALALGFTAEADFDEIIRVYIEDDLDRAAAVARG